MKFIAQIEDGLRADLVRVFCFICLPFVLYYLYLDMQYNSYIENLTSIKPLSYGEYMVSHASDFGLIAYPVAIGSILFFFASFLVRKRTSFTFENQLKQLQANTMLQRMFIGHVKTISRIIHQSMETVTQTDEVFPLTLEEQQRLIEAAAKLTGDLSNGRCANLQKASLNIKDMLDQTLTHFVDRIHKLNLKVHITCPENITIVADSLLIRLIFLNTFGYPLFCTQKNGEITISVAENKGYAHIEVCDNRHVFTQTTQRHFNFLGDFLIQGNQLGELCLQNRFGYEFEKRGEGMFYTKISIPLKDYQDLEMHMEQSRTLH